MQIVCICTVGDGFTYSCEKVVPIEYESCESALVDFEQALKSAQVNEKYYFLFAGCDFETESFRFELPDFYTVSEWFEIRGMK